MSKDDHLRAIYVALCEISPYVRRSMFMAQAVSCVEEQSGRTVLWISEAHHLFATLRYNYARGALGKGAVMHQAELVGIPMWGVYEEHMAAVAELVWKEFVLDPQRYPVYHDDGPRITDNLTHASVSSQAKDPLAVGALDKELKVPKLQFEEDDNDDWVTVDELPVSRIETIDRAPLIGRNPHEVISAAAAVFHEPAPLENKHKSE